VLDNGELVVGVKFLVKRAFLCIFKSEGRLMEYGYIGQEIRLVIGQDPWFDLCEHGLESLEGNALAKLESAIIWRMER
jgi:hypothetical protein